MQSSASSMPREIVGIDTNMIEEPRSSNVTLQAAHRSGHVDHENGRGEKKSKDSVDLEMFSTPSLNPEEKKPAANKEFLVCDLSAMATESQQTPPQTDAHAHGSGQPTLEVIRNLASETPMDPLSSWLSSSPSEDPWSVPRLDCHATRR